MPVLLVINVIASGEEGYDQRNTSKADQSHPSTEENVLCPER
jgi:hypothetical protein